MGAQKYLTKTWLGREKGDLQHYLRQLAIRWRREPTVHRIEHPTRLDRARSLGYKAKQGYVVVRVRIRKGGARKPRPRAGRRQKALGVTRFTRAASLRTSPKRKPERDIQTFEYSTHTTYGKTECTIGTKPSCGTHITPYPRKPETGLSPPQASQCPIDPHQLFWAIQNSQMKIVKARRTSIPLLTYWFLQVRILQ